MSVSLSSIVKTKSNVFAAEVHGELVLFDPDIGCYFSAGHVGERIWALIGDGRKVGDIVDAIVSEYDVDRETAEYDVLAFIQELYEGEVVGIDMP
jgi:hypothetical protein